MGFPPPIPSKEDLPIAQRTLPKSHKFKIKHGPSEYYKEYGWYDIDAVCEDCSMMVFYGGHAGSHNKFWVWPDEHYGRGESNLAKMTCEEYKMDQALE